MNIRAIHVGASEIKLVVSVRNLGAWSDSPDYEYTCWQSVEPGFLWLIQNHEMPIPGINQDPHPRFRHFSLTLL